MAGKYISDLPPGIDRKRKQGLTYEPSLVKGPSFDYTVITVENSKTHKYGTFKKGRIPAEVPGKETTASPFWEITGASMLFTLLAYPATFSGIGLYIAAYMRIVGENSVVDFNHIASVFLLTIVFQTLSSVLAAPSLRFLGRRKLTVFSSVGVVTCILASAYYLHDYQRFFTFYALGAGCISGLALPLPIYGVLKMNENRVGINCGLMNCVIGVILTLLGTLQSMYINMWDPALSWSETIERYQLGKLQDYGEEKFLTNITTLHRTRSAIAYKAVFFVVLLICGLSCSGDEKKEEEETPVINQLTEYVSFEKKARAKAIQEKRKKGTWWDWISLWLLSYFSWLSVIYVHSYWRANANMKYGISAHHFIAVDTVSRICNLLGRIFWGWCIDWTGWKTTWKLISFISFLATLILVHAFGDNILVYSMWIILLYFAHSATFSLIPITSYRALGEKNFIRTYSYINISRAVAGLTAFSSAFGVNSHLRPWIPAIVAILSLLSILIVHFMDGRKHLYIQNEK